MAATLDPLVLDLVAWCAARRRSYGEVMEAWRTSCPRLMVWEETRARGFVETEPTEAGLIVTVTPSGRDLVAASGGRQSARLDPPRIALPLRRAKPARV